LREPENKKVSNAMHLFRDSQSFHPQHLAVVDETQHFFIKGKSNEHLLPSQETRHRDYVGHMGVLAQKQLLPLLPGGFYNA
jgi:hypothetical protein